MSALGDRYTDLAAAVRHASTVVAVGSDTHAGIGGEVAGATEVRAPAGIIDRQPADMTVTVAAGTRCVDLAAALAEVDQECPLDPADAAATVGGTLAAGLSGLRRLGLGPLRETLLEVVVVLADGRVVRGGGPTVKNVTGYDVPRLMVGSLGTLGVIAQVTLRTKPLPRASEWFTTIRSAVEVRAALFAPVAVLETPAGVAVCLEGHPGDLASEAHRAALTVASAPTTPTGEHRGRISVPVARLARLTAELSARWDMQWCAEHGVGTLHVAASDPATLADARRAAHEHGGWLLREAGAPGLDPFGLAPPALALQRRIRTALDPGGKLAPGRVPATEPIRGAA